MDAERVSRLNTQRKNDKRCPRGGWPRFEGEFAANYPPDSLTRFYRDQILLAAMIKCWDGSAAPVVALITQDSEEVGEQAAADASSLHVTS